MERAEAMIVAGIGCSSRAQADEIIGLVDEALRSAGLAASALGLLATLDTRLDHPALQLAARHFGVPLRGYAATELAPVAADASAFVASHTGTGSVAEAAAGLNGVLLTGKHRSAYATCALARIIEVLAP